MRHPVKLFWNREFEAYSIQLNSDFAVALKNEVEYWAKISYHNFSISNRVRILTKLSRCMRYEWRRRSSVHPYTAVVAAFGNWTHVSDFLNTMLTITPVNSQRQQVLSVITPNPGNSGNFFPPRENPFQSHPRLAPTPGCSWDNCDLLYSPTYQDGTNKFWNSRKNQLVNTDISSLRNQSLAGL